MILVRLPIMTVIWRVVANTIQLLYVVHCLVSNKSISNSFFDILIYSVCSKNVSYTLLHIWIFRVIFFNNPAYQFYGFPEIYYTDGPISRFFLIVLLLFFLFSASIIMTKCKSCKKVLCFWKFYRICKIL